jgi:hypothetical protein
MIDPPSDKQTILKFLAETPLKLSKLINGLSETELRWRNVEGEFSALENICHLRDLEREGYAVRIERILNENNPFLTDFDGAQIAAKRDYHREDQRLMLNDFEAARSQNLEKLRALSAEQMERCGTLEGIGECSLARLLEMMREHDEGHLEELSAIRTRFERSAQS